MKLQKQGIGVKEAIKSVEEKKNDIINQLDNYEAKENVEKKIQKKAAAKKYLSGDWVNTEWGWRWEGETDKEGRPIMRKECDSATMYHIDKPSWFYEEGEGKDAKQYKVWCIKFKRTGEEIYAYKKDGKLNQVKFIKKPFDLANRLYVTGHAYQQKDSKGGSE